CQLKSSAPAFFFSGRRRHTSSKRDWSSDVCSSDLLAPLEARLVDLFHLFTDDVSLFMVGVLLLNSAGIAALGAGLLVLARFRGRSEERPCRERGEPHGRAGFAGRCRAVGQQTSTAL